ncbi:hypothetical protein ACFX13_042698 [Malus domestica]
MKCLNISHLKEFALSPEFVGAKFDVIVVDPHWEEYVHRAPGVADHTEYWTFEEIMWSCSGAFIVVKVYVG